MVTQRASQLKSQLIQEEIAHIHCKHKEESFGDIKESIPYYSQILI